jgi:hypothetical protein
MKIIDGKIVLETRECSWCNGKGIKPAQVACPLCKGTMRGPRGGRNSCRKCYNGKVASDTLTVPCPRCNGAKIEPETMTDFMPEELWKSLPFKVIREANGRFGFNENFLGLGYVFTCGDYGAAWTANDEAALIEDVRNTRIHQACAVAMGDGTLCEYVAILVTPNGYKVRAVYPSDVPNVPNPA